MSFSSATTTILYPNFSTTAFRHNRISITIRRANTLPLFFEPLSKQVELATIHNADLTATMTATMPEIKPEMFWLDGAELFKDQPTWWVILVSRKVLSAIMFPGPNGQCNTISEIARYLNIAFSFEGKAREMYGSYTFASEKILHIFTWLTNKKFKRGEEELARMVGDILRWPRDCQPGDTQHPSYVVNKYITYGPVLTPNQLKAFDGVDARNVERLEAFQFVHYIYHEAEAYSPLHSYAAVFDWENIRGGVEPILEDGSLMHDLESRAEERMIHGFVDPDVPSPRDPGSKIDRPNNVERRITEMAEEKRDLFFSRSVPVIAQQISSGPSSSSYPRP